MMLLHPHGKAANHSLAGPGEKARSALPQSEAYGTTSLLDSLALLLFMPGGRSPASPHPMYLHYPTAEPVTISQPSPECR